ncbi:MAG TPA: hypothetical protein VI958_10230 [Acidobacteriota bacterium]
MSETLGIGSSPCTIEARSGPRPTILEFIEAGGANDLKRLGYQCYTIDGKVVVEYVVLKTWQKNWKA